ncbi:hypothetical protein P3X46_023069 [Hevea brasiliensis]|uniref:SLH domain-containing protein n=1 Tax=Hevea brasiliensis TaxID=3981 RepID=A0ABQ9LBI1_HEVBR|nr:uncharacterized protein LOC110646318 [Hevea brasiliensis]KAJ9163397.1 hypothetical protein P3X46_023069 [Hevea brasiliensis]
MCSSASSPPSCLFLRTTSTRPLLGSRCLSPYSFFRSNNPRIIRLSASVADSHLDLSWFSPGHSSNDDGYNGWAVVEAPPRSCKKKGFPTILLGGGTCVAALVAAIAYFSLSRKGFKLQFHSPFRALHGMMSPVDSKADKIEAKNLSTGDSDENAVVAEGSIGFMPEENGETITSVSAQKLERVKVSVPVDSTQLEALSVLKKLKIIEDDVRAEELCTRREYARWLVRLNSLLERNPKHRLVPSMLLSGSVVAAFDDVNVEDSDFDSIQALAEAGIIHSKLSGTNCGSDSSNGDLSFFFYPDRFISRQDLINWKAQLEYRFMPEMTEQMSRIKVDYMDVKEISSDASAELLIDLLAGDQSIIRKVFGQSRRVQPNKPLTKAQAAVALTSGRMTEAIYNEILRLEAENSSRQVAMKEIRSELLDKGDIERFWDEKMNEERARGLEVQKLYIAALHDLEHEKTVQEKTLAEHLKEKATMDCQRQLLLGLKDEVDEMSERLTSERSMYVAEQCKLQELLSELQTKQEGMLDKKSIAEAETEALRILRSWVEDEARKSQARAKVLEEVGRRWKWDNQA